MLSQLEEKVADFIAGQRLLSPGQNVLLAVSGGADSTALLHIMAALKNEGAIANDIYCAHINHQLRGDEAQADEEFVIEQDQKLNIPVITRKIDVKAFAKKEKLSIETAARQLRIESLLDIAKEQNCSYITTAHQKNDNAETIIQRLSRGTGFRGLCGIWPIKEFSQNIQFIRPLLCVNRPQIIDYLKGQGIRWCEDRTNFDCYYRRNFIRNRLIPALQKKFEGDIVEQLAELSESARKFYNSIIRKADIIWPDTAIFKENKIAIKLDIFDKQPGEVKIEIIRRVLVNFNTGEQDLTQQHYENILQLKDGPKLQIPGNLIVSRQGPEINFEKFRKTQDLFLGFKGPVSLKIPGQTDFSNLKIEAEIFDFNEESFKKFKDTKNNYIEWFDFDKIKPPIFVRFRKQGDKYWPLGLAGEKKIGKFLTSAKIRQFLRTRVLIVADSEKIIWLCPVRISEKTKITGDTRKILQLRITDV